MAVANIKIKTEDLEELKKYTQESTGQKAVQKALVHFLREAKQRRVLDVLKEVSFEPDFDPLRLRRHER